MASTSPANRHQAEIAERRFFKTVDSVVSVVGTILKCATVVIIARYIYLAVAVLAGKSTFADVGFRVLGNIKVSDSITYLFGAGGVVYGIGQRQLRRRNIERLSREKNDLERLLDPNRTSSRLTPRGTTRREDIS
jgi:hypothetical protein